MGISGILRAAAISVVLAALAAPGVGEGAGKRYRDWREAVKAGDYAAAYADLFESWRTGTPDVRAESLRYAWRNPEIVAVARPDLVAIVRQVADGHAGDLASLTKAVKDGPYEDRVAFAKLLDRRIDVDAEIRAAYERRNPRPAPPSAPQISAAPAATVPAPATAPPAPPPAPPATAPAPAPMPALRTSAQPVVPPASVPIAGAKHRDWREAVKAGDYAAAYADLFESWRTGTADVRAESLRYAWRNPAIVAVARPDLVALVQATADGHAGDLASLTKTVRNGPGGDRIAFARQVDRNIDFDAEVRAAYERHNPSPALQSAPQSPAAPAATVPAQPTAPPAPAQVVEAKRPSVWRCKGAAACGTAWSAAENFVARNSDMRIRKATPTLIDTYPPIVLGEIGMKVERRALGADESEFLLTVACSAGRLRQQCVAAEERLGKAFPAYLDAALRQ